MATELPTPDELVAVGTAALSAQLDPNGTGEVDVSPGSRNDLAISVEGAMVTRLQQYVADRVRARALSTATGDDLDIIGHDLYGQDRLVAAAATGTITLQRTGTAATTIPKGTRFSVPAVATQQAIVFTASKDVQVNSGVTTGVSVPIVCASTGAVGNVLLSSITAILDTLPDTTWSVTGGATGYAAGGADAETDDVYRARLQQGAFDDSRQRGTKTAIITGALSVAGIASAVVVEPGDGSIVVYAGDANYNLSDALKASLEAELENWRAFGVPLSVRGFTVVTVTVTASVYMANPLSSYDTSALTSAAVAAIEQYFSARPRPDEYFVQRIAAACSSIHTEVQDVVISAPAADVKRPSDSEYGGLSSINRYVVTGASITVTILPPLTQ